MVALYKDRRENRLELFLQPLHQNGANINTDNLLVTLNF